jgi:hypothetical protein
MKQSKFNKIQRLLLVCFLGVSMLVTGQKKTVNEILKDAQKAMENQSSLSCDMKYLWYDTYTSTTPSFSYKGVMIKQEQTVYSKINKTFFITDAASQIAVKCNEAQKALVISKANFTKEQPWELLETFSKQFPKKEISDHGDYWICSLTTDVITQLPYGKVEVHIDKKSSLITKQVLYFLSQTSYKNAQGEKTMGNPKMEITLSNYKKVLTNQEKRTAQLDTYVKRVGSTVKPAGAYKKFEIIQY